MNNLYFRKSTNNKTTIDESKDLKYNKCTKYKGPNKERERERASDLP